MEEKIFVFVSGASGAGKSTFSSFLQRALDRRGILSVIFESALAEAEKARFSISSRTLRSVLARSPLFFFKNADEGLAAEVIEKLLERLNRAVEMPVEVVIMERLFAETVEFLAMNQLLDGKKILHWKRTASHIDAIADAVVFIKFIEAKNRMRLREQKHISKLVKGKTDLEVVLRRPLAESSEGAVTLHKAAEDFAEYLATKVVSAAELERRKLRVFREAG